MYSIITNYYKYLYFTPQLLLYALLVHHHHLIILYVYLCPWRCQSNTFINTSFPSPSKTSPWQGIMV